MATWHSNLGTVLADLGDLDGARTQHERALEISQTTLGPDHPDTVADRATLKMSSTDLAVTSVR
jgi:hypothetical protein